MFDDFETTIAIRKLYEYFEDELIAEDFSPLSAQDLFMSNIVDTQQSWYLINPEKIKMNHIINPDFFIVNTAEKIYLLKAVSLIKAYTHKLPAETPFSERLVYAKNLLPPGFL